MKRMFLVRMQDGVEAYFLCMSSEEDRNDTETGCLLSGGLAGLDSAFLSHDLTFAEDEILSLGTGSTGLHVSLCTPPSHPSGPTGGGVVISYIRSCQIRITSEDRSDSRYFAVTNIELSAYRLFCTIWQAHWEEISSTRGDTFFLYLIS